MYYLKRHVCNVSMYKSATHAMYESTTCANVQTIYYVLCISKKKMTCTLVWVKIKSYVTISRYLFPWESLQSLL